ncbi:MAG: nicotinate-nucleotide--dimethylbenzimidazole phosphoribosyltransferase [Peptostreptococcaceae bacterium]
MSVLEKVSTLQRALENIKPLDEDCMNQARYRLDRQAKPQGSLGKMEDICAQLAGIYKSKFYDTSKKVVIAFGGDHGVYEEGVAPDPQEITKLQFPNFANGTCGVGTIAKFVGADVVAVDVGINTDEKMEGVLDYKIRKCTSNMAKGPAMTRDEAVRCLEIGIEVAKDYIDKGYTVVGIGEMGICNTTPSTAIISVIGDCDPEEITGIGAGLKKERLKHKANVIRNSIKLNQPNPKDGIDILSKVGGFEIGAMAGVILGCSANNTPVVIDGFISYAAALLAYVIDPTTREYMIGSHLSAEPGTQKALEIIKLNPVLNMDMRLGEGTGAALAFNIIEACNFTYKNMVTYDEIDMLGR